MADLNPLAEDLDAILAATAPLWEELRGERLFVTGGTGFFGKWLLESFCWANRRLGLGARAVVLSRDPQRLRRTAPHLLAAPELEFVRGDVQCFAFPDGRFSHVIHAATTSAEATFNHEPPLAKVDTIVGGTRRALDFAVHCGAEKFLLTSSGGAYGASIGVSVALCEDSPGAPDLTRPVTSALGESKRMAELLTRIYAEQHRFEAKLCRCFTFIGPHLQLDIHYAIGNFIRDALRGGPVRVRGDGRPVRSFLYASDLLVALWTMLFRAPAGRLYNVGSDVALSVGEAARRVAALAGTEALIENRDAAPATAGPDVYLPDTSRLRTELGLGETVNFERAVVKTLAYYRAIGLSGNVP